MMEESNNNAVITVTARKKMVQARAGAISLPKVVGMVFGNGGVNLSGQVISPEESQINLKNEIYRKNIDRFYFPVETVCRYECTLSESELVGEEISEIGLYDEDGDIICIKTFSKKSKDNDIEHTYVLDDIF